jgi:hypothetical protein
MLRIDKIIYEWLQICAPRSIQDSVPLLNQRPF